jgi:tetratricopeptide (TPR) repeat protein
MIESGRRRARAGHLEDAIAILKRAIDLNPALKLDPKKEAIKSSVEEIVANGRYLAESGDVEGATAGFERARHIDRSLPIDPVAEARKLAAPGLIVAAEQLVQQGKITESIATFARAQTFDPALKVPAAAWNTMCWIGSLQGHATEVMDACEKAVRSNPEDGRFRTSRGLAKAMAQKGDESLTDFEAFLAWEESEQRTRMSLSRRQWLQSQKLRHEGWIAALGAERNPFTPEELKMLLEDKSSE